MGSHWRTIITGILTGWFHVPRYTKASQVARTNCVCIVSTRLAFLYFQTVYPSTPILTVGSQTVIEPTDAGSHSCVRRTISTFNVNIMGRGVLVSLDDSIPLAVPRFGVA